MREHEPDLIKQHPAMPGLPDLPLAMITCSVPFIPARVSTLAPVRRRQFRVARKSRGMAGAVENRQIFASFHHVPVPGEIHFTAFFDIRKRFRDILFCSFPSGPQQGIIRVQVKGSGHSTQGISPGTGDPHDHTPVELALCRTIGMDSASQETAFRTEKTTGMRILVRKCMITEDLPLVLINAGCERRTGGNRFTGKLEGPNLVIDDNIVAKIHAAGSALPTGKSHIHSYV